MAPKPKNSSIFIGNCQITVEATTFTCNSTSNDLFITLPRSGKIKVSDVSGNHKNASEKFTSEETEREFVLLNPKDVDDISKAYIQEVLEMYMTELPGMNYAANTGKQSKFLERCVTNGKYRTLLLKSNLTGDLGKVIAAITYQIIPADTEYAEIPLAAVNAIYQRKGSKPHLFSTRVRGSGRLGYWLYGASTIQCRRLESVSRNKLAMGIGHLLFLELRKRLQNVGIRSIFCWGDKESEGFWLKQGFSSIAQVDTKGRARRLPVKADIRKALCFPGGSTLMILHLRKELLEDNSNSGKCLPSQPHQNSFTPAIVENEVPESSGELLINLKTSRRTGTNQSKPKALVKVGTSRGHGKLSGFDSQNPKNCCNDTVASARANDDRQTSGADCSQDGNYANVANCSQSTKVAKRAWEASSSSLKSKRVRGSQIADCHSDSSWGFVSEADRTNPCSLEAPHCNTAITENSTKCIGDHMHVEAPLSLKLPSTKQCFRIMLMNITDDAKKTQLAKVIEDLGGTIASDGSTTTHVVTGQVRKTLNFCTALCSGAWVVSSSWLKESFRKGRFVDESPHILNDKDYLLKYNSDLRSAVFRAKACPHALFKGYNICIAANVGTSAKTLSAIVRSAGGNVISGLEKVNEGSTTIFVTCEEDIEEAIMASKKGIRTFSSEWFMNCVMRQELDLEAPQLIESL